MKYSIIVPVYKNEDSIPRLIEVLGSLNQTLNGEMEAVFVVDGSPDKSFELLKNAITKVDFSAQLIAHSRNFGSLAAIRTGFTAARGEYFAGMAADLQEPPELIEEFFKTLAEDECDVVIGTRISRNDPLISRIASGIFWGIYRRFVVPEMPKGGVDVFGCNRIFREHLLKLDESRSSLIAIIFWLGFRRKVVGYTRQERLEGRSAWTLSKKIDYMMDSIFSFTDYPIRLLLRIGGVGSLAAIILGTFIFIARLAGAIEVPGYAATIVAVLMLGAMNLLGLGLVGTYAWRGYENSKRRPHSIIAIRCSNDSENVEKHT